jgi:hypothetical protein
MKNLIFWGALIMTIISIVLGVYFTFVGDYDKTALWLLVSIVFGFVMGNNAEDKK